MDVLSSIKTALKKAGVPEKYASTIQALFEITNEENLDHFIGLFKKNILQDLSSENQSSQSIIEEYEKKYGLKDGKPTNPEKKNEKPVIDQLESGFENVPPSVVELFKAQQKQISDLAASVIEVTSNLTTSTKQTSAKALFADAKLPDKWFKRIDVNSDTPVEAQIKELQTEYSELKQNLINEEISEGGYKPNYFPSRERSEKEWLELMNKDDGGDKPNGVVNLGIE